MKSTLLALSVILIGCGNTDTTTPDTNNLQPDAQVATTQSSTSTITASHTASATGTTTSITTKTATTPDAGTTPDRTPTFILTDSSVPDTLADTLVQVVQIDALPATQDTLPQTTPDTQPAQQPDALPMTVDTKPATPDTLVLVDTKPSTTDTLPAIDTLPATPDTQPAVETVTACGGDNQACCVTQAVDMPAGYWIHTCTDSVKATYDCTITTSIGTGPSGTCMPCGYKGYPGCTHRNLGMFSWKWTDTMTGTCDHDGWQTPVCTNNVCLCP